MDDSPRAPIRLLLLGGTSEASDLARALANDPTVSVTVSLAGRTRAPSVLPVATRSGGFGGAEGLAAFIAAERIEALVDATHPFATQISANAVRASRSAGVPLLVLCRPEWAPVPGDRWTLVPDARAAATTLGAAPRRVLLTIGQRDLAPFAAADHHAYVVRAVEPPDPGALPANAEIITARGPFALEDEKAMLRRRRISVIVTKNSGGAATYPKLEAARMLGLPVILLVRPMPPEESPPSLRVVSDVASALRWVHRTAAMLRGV